MKESMLCTKTHEYVLEQGSCYEVGITDYAIEQLGDIVFIELPEVDSEFSKNEVFATIESVKAASEIYMPVSGKVVEVNTASPGVSPSDTSLISSPDTSAVSSSVSRLSI